MFLSSNGFAAQKHNDYYVSETPQKKASAIYTTKCEDVFMYGDTKGFIGVSKRESVAPFVAADFAKINARRKMKLYLNDQLQGLCKFDKKLRKTMDKGILTDSMFLALSDTMVVHFYTTSIDSICSEIRVYKDSETGYEKYYSYYVVEYEYSKFVNDLRSLTQLSNVLPKGISVEMALQIAECIEQKGLKYGGRHVHKCHLR